METLDAAAAAAAELDTILATAELEGLEVSDHEVILAAADEQVETAEQTEETAERAERVRE